MDRILGTCTTGPLYLAMPEIANMVAKSICQRHLDVYDLHAWAIMPNHVHLLITPLDRTLEDSALFKALHGDGGQSNARPERPILAERKL